MKKHLGFKGSVGAQEYTTFKPKLFFLKGFKAPSITSKSTWAEVQKGLTPSLTPILHHMLL